MFLIIIGNADVVLLNSMGNETEAGVYAAATRAARLSAFLLLAVNAIVAPVISQAYARGENENLTRICRYAITLAFWPSFGLALVLILFGVPILEIFRDGYG
ncbi:MAG: MATE family efflux transporter [Planctomycetaceae bacterium]